MSEQYLVSGVSYGFDVTIQSNPPDLDGPLTESFRLVDALAREDWFSAEGVDLDDLVRGDEKTLLAGERQQDGGER